MENQNPTGSLAMENPFTFKFGQVMTGFGVGCGIGIGVGRPLNLGAIPVLHQVMSATRGATDAFSGVGRHVNTSFRKLGMKGIEAGVGCGVGIGHGFGIGLAVKPGVVHQIQACIGQAMVKMMMKLGIFPGLSASRSILPASVQSSTHLLTAISERSKQTPIGEIMHLAPKSKTGKSTSQSPKGDDGLHMALQPDSVASDGIPPKIPLRTHSEKVINSFLQNPILQNEKEMELNELAGRLQSENNVLQVLLKHQRIIEELTQENSKLRRVLVEDLKVSPAKLEFGGENRTIPSQTCVDCLECRRRRRRSRR